MNAEIKIGNSSIMLNDEFPEMGCCGPLSLGGTPVTIHMYVEDADSVFSKAVAAGAKVRMPLQDMFWGDRYGVLIDPYGHSWAVATRIEELTPEQLGERARIAFSGGICSQ